VDVVAVGALNLDLIVAATGAPLVVKLAAALADAGVAYTAGSEHVVSEQVMGMVLEVLDATEWECRAGGSAYDTIRGLANIDGIATGGIGVVGSMPALAIGRCEQIGLVGVDGWLVRRDPDRSCGISISVQDAGTRTLISCAGVNAGMAAYIRQAFAELVIHLSAARIIHVTSMPDPYTPPMLAKLLRTVKRHHPATRLCVDPGPVWAASADPDVTGILSLADVVLLNHSEFVALGRLTAGQREGSIAGIILRRHNPAATLVVKRPTGVARFTSHSGDVRCDFYGQSPMVAQHICDDPGVGAAFAAGLLAALIGDPDHPDQAPWLGLAFAADHLQHGRSGTDFNTIFTRFTASRSTGAGYQVPGPSAGRP
jgi:sugar/nucleoside kinase (ribokinase family)